MQLAGRVLNWARMSHQRLGRLRGADTIRMYADHRDISGTDDLCCQIGGGDVSELRHRRHSMPSVILESWFIWSVALPAGLIRGTGAVLVSGILYGGSRT
jgi:hypothetical protein